MLKVLNASDCVVLSFCNCLCNVLSYPKASNTLPRLFAEPYTSVWPCSSH